MEREKGEGNLSNNHGEEHREDRTRATEPQRRRGRPPKPIDLHAALELTLIGASLRDKARQAGCSPRTLMGRHAPLIELAEARISGLLKQRLFSLAVVEENTRALLFLLRRIYEAESKEQAGGDAERASKWSRRQLQQAMRIVCRYSGPKPPQTYKKPRSSYRRYPTPRAKKYSGKACVPNFSKKGLK